jgi:hypothetical protein
VGAGVAAAYIAASVLGGICAAALGMTLARRLKPRLRVADEHAVADGYSEVDYLDPDLP